MQVRKMRPGGLVEGVVALHDNVWLELGAALLAPVERDAAAELWDVRMGAEYRSSGVGKR